MTVLAIIGVLAIIAAGYYFPRVVASVLLAIVITSVIGFNIIFGIVVGLVFGFIGFCIDLAIIREVDFLSL
jgi:hypothetical protein